MNVRHIQGQGVKELRFGLMDEFEMDDAEALGDFQDAGNALDLSDLLLDETD